LLTWRFGLIGTAIANLITTLLLTSSYMYLTQRIHPLIIDHALMKKLLLLGAIILGGAALWVPIESSPTSFLAKLAALLAVFVVGHRLGLSLPYALIRAGFGKKEKR